MQQISAGAPPAAIAPSAASSASAPPSLSLTNTAGTNELLSVRKLYTNIITQSITILARNNSINSFLRSKKKDCTHMQVYEQGYLLVILLLALSASSALVSARRPAPSSGSSRYTIRFAQCIAWLYSVDSSLAISSLCFSITTYNHITLCQAHQPTNQPTISNKQETPRNRTIGEFYHYDYITR